MLDVIRDEDLIGNARRTGDRLLRRLREIAKAHRALGEIRGCAPFAGVDVAANPAIGLDARRAASRTVNRLRHERVLIGTAGGDSRVLKIQPLLVFGPQEADLLRERLRSAIAT